LRLEQHDRNGVIMAGLGQDERTDSSAGQHDSEILSGLGQTEKTDSAGQPDASRLGQAKQTGQADNAEGGNDRVVTVPEAAALLGVSVDGVRKRLARGKLAGVKIDGAWLVQLDRTPVSVSRPASKRTPSTAEMLVALTAEIARLREDVRQQGALLSSATTALEALRLAPPAPAAPTPEQPPRDAPVEQSEDGQKVGSASATGPGSAPSRPASRWQRLRWLRGWQR
jgi:hypothetical protein